MKEVPPTAASPIVEYPSSCPARRPWSTWERLVCVPLGLLWLLVLIVVVVPVCIYMTILYLITCAARSLAGKRPAPRNAGIVVVTLFLMQALPIATADHHRRGRFREEVQPVAGSVPMPGSNGGSPGTVLRHPGM